MRLARPTGLGGQPGRSLFSVMMALAAALLAASCSDLAYLRAKVEYQDQIINEMESKLQEWKDAYDKLLEQKVKDNEAFQKHMKNWEMEKRRLMTIRSDRERTLETSENELKLRLQAEMDKNTKLRTDLDTAQGRATLADKDVVTLKSARSQLEKDLASARTQIETSRGQAQAAENARQAAESQAKQLQTTLGERNEKIKELEQTVAALQNDVRLASDSKTTMSVLVADLRKQLAEEKRVADDERQRHRKEVARLTGELASLRGTTKGQDSTLSRIKDELATLLAEESKEKNTEVIGSYDRVTVRILSDALFEPATLSLRQSAQTRLRQIAQVLVKYPNYQLQVEGHTDNQPVRDMPFADNLALSTQRANNVLRFLKEAAKLPQKQIRSTGCADSKPIASNETAEGRQRNRRVEIILAPEE